jgi:hypothetical protein
MWAILAEAAGSILGGWIDLKKAKYTAEAKRYEMQAQAEADWDQEALRQAQYSWKDELITLVIYAPLVVAWFNPEKAMAWVEFVDELPVWYQLFMGGILAASFGLRWLFKNKLANGFKQNGQ